MRAIIKNTTTSVRVGDYFFLIFLRLGLGIILGLFFTLSAALEMMMSAGQIGVYEY